MLTELFLRDIALFPELSLRFSNGLNVLSGETGAGKSLIIGSLRLLCGERPAPGFVRDGAERGVVEAIFELDPRGRIAAELESLGVAPEDGELILRREVVPGGKGRIRANGAAIPTSLLKSVAAVLFDLHGQHDHQSLLRPSFQQEALDAYANLGPLLGEFRSLYQDWRQCAVELQEAVERFREDRERDDLARFQLSEIEAADPSPGEWEKLQSERGRLEEASSLRATARRVQEAVSESEESIRDVAAQLEADARQAAESDRQWRDVADGLQALAIAADEISRDARVLEERAVDDPERLAIVRERTRVLHELLRKYGPDESDVVALYERLRAEVTDPEDRASRVERLRGQLQEISDRLQRSGRELTKRRLRAGKRLSREVRDVLEGLGMEGTVFEAKVTPRKTAPSELPEVGPVGPTGLDAVEFHLAPNAGEPGRKLSDIASGGEISRVMLALKSVMSQVQATATMVFDEIDAGVGGRVAARIGETLAELASDRQVFCITHLATIAAKAPVQYRVEKRSDDGRTISHVQSVEGDERVAEIVRMLGGEADESVAWDHARKLLQGVNA